MKDKNDLVKKGYVFDYGWRKEEKIKLFNKEINIEVVFDAYFKKDEITSYQFETYNNLIASSKIIDIINEDKIKIINYLNSLANKKISEEEIDSYIKVKQLIIINDSKNKEVLGIYCESKLDIDNGIGIKIENYKVTEVSIGDIIL